MKVCKRCGKPLNQCFCYTDVGLDEILEQWKKEKVKGNVRERVTEEDIREQLKQKPPRTKSDLEHLLDFMGLDENARRQIVAKAKKSLLKSAKRTAHDLIDELIPNAEDLVIEADYEVECPVCGKMVKDLENHECRPKS